VATDDSLNQSINKAQRHYSSLFFLPSFKTAVAAITVLCIATGLSTSIFFSSFNDFAVGLLLGVALLATNLTVDLVLSKTLRDPIFVLRRTVVLSLFSWGFWFIFIIIGTILGAMFGFLWGVKLCLLGFATLVTLRTVVLISVSSATFNRRLVAILLQPFACVAPLTIFWAAHGVAPVDYLPFLIVSPFIAFLSAYTAIHLLDSIGKKTYNVPSINIFKAFMLNWVASLNAPLEDFLEKMGEDADIEVSLLKFDASTPQGAIIVPLVHPGPFKNIGSSLLPSMLKEEFEKEYNCVACVPLGLLGHELDAASQAQNHKIINYVINSARFQSSIVHATQFVRVSEGFVGASCQVFGKTAFLSFTLSPKTTEDLPQELGSIVREEAGKFGLDAIVVNAHNSLTDTSEIEASLETLRDVAAKCLKMGASQEILPFEVGTSSVHPVEFSLKDGMGTGGITVTIVKVGTQKTVYVVIDGNNMVSGLREKILTALSKVGFQEGEVFTTDTHAVSAVVLGRRGYHPLGEAMDHEALINQIKNAALIAEGNLKSSRAGCLRFTVPKVRVIGSECLESISVLVDQTIQKAKRIMPPIFVVEGLLLILLLLLF
jgi:putative membrane protein